MIEDQRKYNEIQKWTKIRKWASIAMLFGFASIVLGYFFLSDRYAIIALWVATIIVPHAVHTIAGKKLKKLESE